jgi:hypothetical protein
MDYMQVRRILNSFNNCWNFKVACIARDIISDIDFSAKHVYDISKIT